MKSRNFAKLLLIAGDIFLLYGALFLSLFLRYYFEYDPFLVRAHIIPFSIVFLLWLLLLGAFGLYDLRILKNEKGFLLRLLRAGIAAVVAAIVFFYLFPQFSIEPRRNLFLIAGFSVAFMFGWRYVFNILIARTGAARVLFLGVSKETEELAAYLTKNAQLGYSPAGYVLEDQAAPDAPALSLPVFPLESLKRTIQILRADTIIFLREAKDNPHTVTELYESIPFGIEIGEFTNFYERMTGKIPLSLIKKVWFLENLIGQSRPGYSFLKRVFDIACGIAIGSVALILFPFIALGILLSTPRDIIAYKEKRARSGDGIFLFRQKRVGKNGAVFDFIKFRSLRLGAETMSETKEMDNDPRQYPFGLFLRRSYLDELGQVWNVLVGEMSFIGPRPERPQYVEELKKKVPFYEMRLLVPPGITGWAQINMENDASVEDAPEKMQYDLYYIKNRSLGLDLAIALRTLYAMLHRQGR